MKTEYIGFAVIVIIFMWLFFGSWNGNLLHKDTTAREAAAFADCLEQYNRGFCESMRDDPQWDRIFN